MAAGQTREQFVATYAAGSGLTEEDLRGYGLFPEPCDCGEQLCTGWKMGRPWEDALFEDMMSEATNDTKESKK